MDMKTYSVPLLSQKCRSKGVEKLNFLPSNPHFLPSKCLLGDFLRLKIASK